MAQTAFAAPRVVLRRLVGGYLVAEGAAYSHYLYAEQRARRAPPGERRDRDDQEYAKRFLSLARCEPGEVTSSACLRFVRHAFYGTSPEALPREAVAGWLRSHLGDAADEAAFQSLLTALGPHAPKEATTSGNDGVHPEGFVYGEGPVRAWYKPLPLKLLVEVRRWQARRRLRAAGFVEHRVPNCPLIRFWELAGSTTEDNAADPPLVILHGYGMGVASPLFWKMLPKLGRRSVVIVDCPWLLVTRVPASWDITLTPTVREIATVVARYLAGSQVCVGEGSSLTVDLIGHSFGTAVASALTRELASAVETLRPAVSVRKCVLMDPMCFMPGITKQAQLLRRAPGDLAAELLEEAAAAGQPTASYGEVLSSLFSAPEPCGVCPSEDAAEAARERRKWVIFQTYYFFYFIFRDLVYSWVNSRSLHGSDYLDRGHLRAMNRDGRLLTILAETDTLIPAAVLRDDLSSEAPSGSWGGVLWLPTVGHGACQHRDDVVQRVNSFLAAA